MKRIFFKYGAAVLTTPQVPRYVESVENAPIQTPRTQGLGPEAFGAGLGQGLQRVGNIGLALAKEERDKAVRTMTIEGRTKIDQAEVDLLYHPEKGALAKKGKNTFGIEEPTLKAFDESISKLEQEMTAPEARDALKLFGQQRRVEIQKQIQRHVSGETRAYVEETNKASLESTLNNVMTFYQDPDRVDQERKYGLGVIMVDNDNKGLPPEVVKMKAATWESMVHRGVIERMSVDSPSKAKEYFEKNRDWLLPTDAAKIEGTLKPLVSKQAGMDTALELARPFAGITDPMELDKAVDVALAEAQTRHKSNPDAYNIAEAQIYQVAAKREKGINIARREVELPINRAMANARKEGRIPSLDDFDQAEWSNLVSINPDKANDILRNIQNESRMERDRREAKLDREEGRRERKELKAERDKLKEAEATRKKNQNTNFSNLWGNPRMLADADITGMVGMGDLTPEDGAKLETRLKSYDPDHIFAEARGVDKVLKAANVALESDEATQVRRYVADRIINSKERPTPEQVLDFTREAVYDVDVTVWNRRNKPAYQMSINDVPKDEQAEIKVELQRRRRAVTDGNIVAAYVAQQRKESK